MKYIDAEKLIATLERQNVDKKVIEPLIRIIDSLQQEQPVTDCNNLEEAAGEYLDNHKPLARYNWGDLMDAFKAGADWQYQKDRREFAKLKAKEWMSGYDDAVSKFAKIPYKAEDWCGTEDGVFIGGATFDELVPEDVELYYKRKNEQV